MAATWIVRGLASRSDIHRALPQTNRGRSAPRHLGEDAPRGRKEAELRQLVARLTASLQERDMQLDAQRQTSRALSLQLAERDGP